MNKSISRKHVHAPNVDKLNLCHIGDHVIKILISSYEKDDYIFGYLYNVQPTMDNFNFEANNNTIK